MNGEYVATPETLKKIASRAHNGVTFNQLMVAAGHISEDDIKEEIIPNRNKNNYWLGKEEKSLQDYPEGFMSFEDYSKSPISDLDPIISKLHLSEIAELSPEKQELFFAIVENAIKGLKK